MGVQILLAKLRGRVPKLSCEGEDIVRQLNYVAAQMPSACRRWQWGEVHAGPLREAAREIRRLRAIVYGTEAVPQAPRPDGQYIGTPAGYSAPLYWQGRA